MADAPVVEKVAMQAKKIYGLLSHQARKIMNAFVLPRENSAPVSCSQSNL